MLALLLLTLTLAPIDQIVPPPPGVKVANERVVLMTDAGNIVIALYPEIAPKNVQQIMNLVQAGVYNGTCFPRIEKNFVMQLSAAESDRIPPLPGNLMSLIRPLPAEHSQLKHVRGVISMAREDKDINSAKTSFSILLGSAPHLDGNYTIVGLAPGVYELKVSAPGYAAEFHVERFLREVMICRIAPVSPDPFPC